VAAKVVVRARFRAESLAADADAAFACFGSALGAIVTLLPRFGGAIAGVLFAFTFSAARRAWSTFVTALSGAWTFCSCFAPPPLPLLRPASAASGVLLMRTCAAGIASGGGSDDAVFGCKNGEGYDAGERRDIERRAGRAGDLDLLNWCRDESDSMP
jgi:hypothetical protein